MNLLTGVLFVCLGRVAATDARFVSIRSRCTLLFRWVAATDARVVSRFGGWTIRIHRRVKGRPSIPQCRLLSSAEPVGKGG
jgi:hypothetical protein